VQHAPVPSVTKYCFQDIEDLFDDVDIDRTGRVSAAEVWSYLMYDTDEL
jgi:hypothetical protein